MARILIWMSPEPGHILPLVSVARQLLRNGHVVVFHSTGAMRTDLEAMGFTTVQLFPQMSEQRLAGLRAAGPSALSFYKSLLCRFPSPSAHRQAFRDEICRAAALVDADLLIVDGIFGRSLGLQIETAVPGRIKVALFFCHLPYSPLSQEFLQRRVKLVFLAPKEFEIPDLFVPSALYAGSALCQNLDADFPWCRLDSSKHLIYCCFGSQIEQYPNALKICGEIAAASKAIHNCQFLINVGCFDSEVVPPLDDILIVHHVPQFSILAKSAAIICHGGFGTIKESIWHGVPMLIIPHRWDQPANARRVVYHQLGDSLSPKDAISARISHVLADLITNEDMHRRLSAMQKTFRDGEDTSAIANGCELWLRE